MLIEFCCDKNSTMGKVEEEMGLTICRMFQERFDMMNPAQVNQLLDFVRDYPGISLWGSIPCTAWCSWQHLSVHKIWGALR